MPSRIVAVRRIVQEQVDSREADESNPGDPTPPTDPQTRKYTDSAGLRWDLGKIYTEPLDRQPALALAKSFDRLIATPPSFRPHMLKMRQANLKLEVFYWTVQATVNRGTSPPPMRRAWSPMYVYAASKPPATAAAF